MIRDAFRILFVSLMAVSFTFAAEKYPDYKSAVAGNNSFALDLYSMLKAEQGNLFFSPFSISPALAMTYGGARGDTAEEMAKALHFAPGADKTHAAFSALDTAFDEIQKKGRCNCT